MMNVYVNLDFRFGKKVVANVPKALLLLLIDLHVSALMMIYINQSLINAFLDVLVISIGSMAVVFV